MYLVNSNTPTTDIFSGEVKEGPTVNLDNLDTMIRCRGQVNGEFYFSIRFNMRNSRVYAWHYGTEADRDLEWERLFELNRKMKDDE